MAKGNLDPGFLAAPYFGDSSFDPIEAVRNIKATQYKNASTRQKELDDDLEKGLKDLALDIKGWDDQQGFDEISGDLEHLRSKYVEFGSQGLNLSRPSNIAEQKLSKGFHTQLNKLKQKHDVWQVEKQRVDEAVKIIQNQLTKPEEERDIDVEATLQAIKDWKSSPGKVIERAEKATNLIVGKARPVDIGKHVLDNIAKTVPGLDKEIKSWSWDPTTNKFAKVTQEGMSEPRLLAGMTKIMNNAPVNIKNAIEKEYQSDPEKGIMSKAEWFRKRYAPEYPTREDRVMTGGSASGSTKLDWNMILPGKTESGGYDTSQFKESKSFGVPIVEKDKAKAGDKETFNSAATIPLQGVFKTVFTMPNAVHAIDAETGLQAPQARSAANMADNIAFIPIASKDMKVTVGNKTRVFKAGDKLPASVQRQLEKEGRTEDFIYDAFLTTLTSYKQLPKDTPEMFKGTGMEDFDWGIGSNAATTVTPWREASRYVKAAAMKAKVDLDPLDKFIDEYLNELNSMASIFGENIKETDYQKIYGEQVPQNK